MNALESAIENAEQGFFKAFLNVSDVVDATALWAALSKSLDDSARARITELGGDFEAARSALDRFSLHNPI